MTEIMKEEVRKSVQVFKTNIQIEKGDRFFYLTDGFISIVAKRFYTEQRAISYAKKTYGVVLIPRFQDFKIPETISNFVEKWAE